MDRIASLITKLKEQHDKSEGSAALLTTIQLLQFELTKSENQVKELGTAKVAVVLPIQQEMAASVLIETKEPAKQEAKEAVRQELNEVVKPVASLNDQLVVKSTELGESLKGTPVQDLRKAIGVNDRFLFIKDLFRGDESHYEMSIKTINNFHVYQEAEFWIARELKLKLGWKADSEVVQQFDQLVRRRFS
jgi:protein subunit release factor A